MAMRCGDREHAEKGRDGDEAMMRKKQKEDEPRIRG
jgi:hypothetical protein